MSDHWVLLLFVSKDSSVVEKPRKTLIFQLRGTDAIPSLSCAVLKCRRDIANLCVNIYCLPRTTSLFTDDV